jgi:hypothetical protein
LKLRQNGNTNTFSNQNVDGMVLALMIDVLPLQLKEDDTPAYLINAKDPGKYIDGNITSFRVLFTLPSRNGHEDDKYCV